jgi:glycerol-3-phosphate cytidylyltransferase
MKEYGYIGMSADILHIGHIRVLKKCRAMCNHLIVGLMTDECIRKYKGNDPSVPYKQRKEILESVEGVDWVIPQDSFAYGHNIMTVKDFWKDDFIIFDSEEHKRTGADIIFPRTEGISSTDIKRRIYETFVPCKCST